MGLKDFVSNASGAELENAVAKLKADFFCEKKFIDNFNPLLSDAAGTISNYEKDQLNSNHTPNNNSYRLSFEDASTYLASSTFLHSFDGWIYLSNAIDALIKGDAGVAVHLAYYAELRATMSFLASEGIGVFNDKHLIIKSDKTFDIEGKLGGTHSFIWDAIQEWSTSPTVDSLKLLKIFSVLGHTFDEWALAFHPRVTAVMSNTIIQDWLRKWNFDVKTFRDDKILRGEVSYRPQRLIDYSQTDLSLIIKRVIDFWRLIEPTQRERFEFLDKHLLRLLLKQLHEKLVELHDIKDRYEDLIENIFTNLSEPDIPSLKDILLGNSTNSILEESRNPSFDRITGEINPFAVSARATLMLRLSTGRVSNLFRTASITQNDLKFWCDNIGINNGFWLPNNYPNNFYELWPTIEDKIENFSDFIRDESEVNLFRLNEELPNQLALFKQFHRAALWGLAI